MNSNAKQLEDSRYLLREAQELLTALSHQPSRVFNLSEKSASLVGSIADFFMEFPDEPEVSE